MMALILPYLYFVEACRLLRLGGQHECGGGCGRGVILESIVRLVYYGLLIK